MNFLRKSLILLLISTIIFSSGAPVIYAEMVGLDPISSAVTEKALGDIMNFLGVDQEAITSTVQTANVLRQKATPPQVKLVFTPSSPVPGMPITASASASYFINDPAILYYNWYLKRGYCKTIDKGDDNYNTKYNSRCDLNNDDDVDIEDYKIEAMRIIASGNFDWQRAMGKDAPACQDQPRLDYCNAPNQYLDAEPDDDGYEAIFGGEDQKGKNSHCYVHNIATGNETEIVCDKHLFPNAPDEETGNGKFNLEEEAFWHTNPNSKDTSNSGVMDEAAVAGLGRNTLTWNYMTGDKVGVAVEGASIESTDYEDSSYKLTWAISGNPEIKSEGPSGSGDERLVYSFSKPGGDYCGGGSCTVNVTCSGTVESYTIPASGTRYEVGAGGAVFLWKPLSDNEAFPPHLVVLISGDKEESCTVCIAGDECGDFVGRMSDEFEKNVTIEDINTSLEDGFVEPSEGTADQKMEVSLSYQPDSPMNSESEDNADQLIVQSSIVGVENKSFLNYAWQVYLSSDIGAEDKDWRMLTLADLEDQTGLKKLSGIGIDSLKMNLNFKDSLPALGADQKTFYAKIVLRAVEGIDETKKEGVGTIIVPIQLSSNTLKVFSAKVADSLALNLDTDAERCNSGVSLAICPVIKNEIIGVKLDLSSTANYDFLWSFDNAPVTETEKNIAYIPILGERDSQHILSLTAINKTTGEKILLTRTFEVVDPTISLTSTDTDTCAPTLLGYYIDPINANPNPATGMDASAWPDLSLDKFEALSGEIIRIKPSFNTPISGDNAAWFFDGVQITTANMSALGVTEIEDDGTLVFIANKAVGEKYEITLSALYTQPNLIKKALYSIWEVPQTNFYEKLISQTIEIKVTDSLSGSGIIAQTKSPQQKILASLFSAIPSYITFLFRVVLTMLLILFLIHTLFSIFPEQKRV